MVETNGGETIHSMESFLRSGNRKLKRFRKSPKLTRFIKSLTSQDLYVIRLDERHSQSSLCGNGISEEYCLIFAFKFQLLPKYFKVIYNYTFLLPI